MTAAIVHLPARRPEAPAPTVTPAPKKERVNYDMLTDEQKAIFDAGHRVGRDEGYLDGLQLVRDLAAHVGVPVPRHLAQAI